MARYLVVGNSGSGKSTLAARLARAGGLEHLDLDPIAWQLGVTPPQRRPVAESTREIVTFMDAHDAWVIEGCYADLGEAALPRCTLLVFLNPGADACVANARLRPWEPHKYPSQQEQDASLDFLVGWIHDYETRGGSMSLAAHRAIFDGFAGAKVELMSREAIAAFTPKERRHRS